MVIKIGTRAVQIAIEWQLGMRRTINYDRLIS